MLLLSLVADRAILPSICRRPPPLLSSLVPSAVSLAFHSRRFLSSSSALLAALSRSLFLRASQAE